MGLYGAGRKCWWGGTEAVYFLEFLLVASSSFHGNLVLELGAVIKAIEQAVHQRGSSSSPHAGESLISSKI